MDFLWNNIFRSKDKNKSLRKSLQSNVLFQDLSSSELNLLEKIVHLRHHKPSESIFAQGEVGVGMYIIVSGSVNIYVEEVNPTNQTLQTTHITQLKEGDFFGELALVENESRRSASATAHDEVTLIGFYKPDLDELTARNPQAGVKILMRLGEVLGARLRQTTARMSEVEKANHRLLEGNRL